MDFIPKKLKEAFARKSKPKKSDALKPFLQKEGYYLLEMKIEKPEKDKFLIKSPDMSDLCIFYTMPIDLTTLVILNASVKTTAAIKYGLNHTSVFFKHKKSDLYIDGNDKNIGLPEGSDFQIVLIPKGCKWRPSAKPAEEYSGGKPTKLKPPL